VVNRLARGEAPITEVEGSAGVEFRTRGADTIGAIVSGSTRGNPISPPHRRRSCTTCWRDVLDEAAFAAARFAERAAATAADCSLCWRC